MTTDATRGEFKITASYKDPAMEIMSRFAQLAFGEMMEKMGAGSTATDAGDTDSDTKPFPEGKE